MRKIKLEFKLNNLPEVDLLEFADLLNTLDLINNLGYEIIDENEFLSENIESYNSSIFSPDIRPGFSKINKQSPTTIEIIFGSIGAFWLLVQIVDKVRKWNIDKNMLDMQHEKLEYETQKAYIELMEAKDRTYDKLNLPENEPNLNKVIDKLENSNLSVEGLNVIEEVERRRYA